MEHACRGPEVLTVWGVKGHVCTSETCAGINIQGRPDPGGPRPFLRSRDK